MSTQVNFIDLHHQKHFSFSHTQCDSINLKNKKLPIVARLTFDDIITHNFKLEKPLSAQELLVTCELKMYDEIGLDATKAHKISYALKSATSGDLKLVESFAIDKNSLKEKYQESLSTLKHLDFLAIPFLVFETLYTHQVLEKKNDLFIMIDEKEAFSTFYKEGEYVTSKKTNSLSEMVKELENSNINTTTETLKKTLLEKGLNKEAYHLSEYDLYDYLQKKFESFFSKTDSIAMHNRNVYGLSSVDRIFFSLDNQMIPGLAEMAKSFFTDASVGTLDFWAQDGIASIDAISASYALDKLEAKEQLHNFTIYEKKEAFYKSEIGKFALASCAAMLLLSAYPLYQQYQINTIEAENSTLKEQLNILSATTAKLKKKQTAIKKEITLAQKEQKKINSDFHKLQRIADSLLTLKSRDSKYTPMFLTINDLLKKYKLSVENVKQVGKGTVDFEIYSLQKRRDTIAKFMASLLSHGYTSVTSNEISQSKNLYKSIITVKR